jgi:hypothetical protein
MLAADALTALRAGDGASRVSLARFFAENLAVQAPGLEHSVIDGSASITGGDAALAG